MTYVQKKTLLIIVINYSFSPSRTLGWHCRRGPGLGSSCCSPPPSRCPAARWSQMPPSHRATPLANRLLFASHGAQRLAIGPFGHHRGYWYSQSSQRPSIGPYQSVQRSPRTVLLLALTNVTKGFFWFPLSDSSQHGFIVVHTPVNTDFCWF